MEPMQIWTMDFQIHLQQSVMEHVPASDDDGLLAVPRRVVSHDLCMGGDVLWGQLGRLIRLGMDPAEGLHFLFKERS